MRRFGLIGRPLGHSASAKYFTEKFRKEGLSDCEYALYELPSVEELPSLLAAMPELCGLNVTIPYKRSVMHLLDRIAPEAQVIGAVNCIRRLPDGTLEGHNTDIAGLRAALDRLLGGAEPAQALVLGTGGASQAVQYALAERGIPFALVSRDAAKGNYTYDNLPCEAVARGDLPRRRGSAANPLCLYHAGAFSARPGLQPAADSFSRLRSPARGARTERRDDVPRAGRGVVENMEYLKRDMNQKL